MTLTMPVPKDLDFLSARLHGRCSRLAEGAHLDELSRIRTVSELSRSLYPDARLRSAPDLQRLMVAECVREISDLAAAMTGAGAALLSWQRVRFQAENVKVLARGFANGTALDLLRPHLIDLPDGLALDVTGIAEARSFDAFVAALPPGPLQEAMAAARDAYRAQPRPFILETAVDCGYLRELLRRAQCLMGEERGDVLSLAGQEAGTFLLMLAARGLFHYRLKPAMLAGMYVAGASLSRRRFAAMLAAPDLQSMAAQAIGRVIDAAPTPVEATDLESLAWSRFLRLANAAFRRSHMGVGAVIGYVAIRRIELANLITLSEGMRMGLDPRAVRSRLIPHPSGEVARV
jgi:vacuolar-type H+-ATPase subunit C/Vma6